MYFQRWNLIITWSDSTWFMWACEQLIPKMNSMISVSVNVNQSILFKQINRFCNCLSLVFDLSEREKNRFSIRFRVLSSISRRNKSWSFHWWCALIFNWHFSMSLRLSNITNTIFFFVPQFSYPLNYFTSFAWFMLKFSTINGIYFLHFTFQA